MTEATDAPEEITAPPRDERGVLLCPECKQPIDSEIHIKGLGSVHEPDRTPETMERDRRLSDEDRAVRAAELENETVSEEPEGDAPDHLDILDTGRGNVVVARMEVQDLSGGTNQVHADPPAVAPPAAEKPARPSRSKAK